VERIAGRPKGNAKECQRSEGKLGRGNVNCSFNRSRSFKWLRLGMEFAISAIAFAASTAKRKRLSFRTGADARGLGPPQAD